MTTQATSVDPAEIAKFDALAARWWDPDGPHKGLHLMGPARLDYVVDQVCAETGRDPVTPRAFDGLTALDVGCGGGLLSEPLARLGATVTGIDAAGENLPVARRHAETVGLDIDYRHTTAEALAADGARFDLVAALEVVEHVPDPGAFLATCASLVAPGGLLIVSTLNRTPQSFALAIVAAERVLCWLPPGTHDWRRFVTPDEMSRMLGEAGLDVVDRTGFVFDPMRWTFGPAPRDLTVNYAATAVKRG